MQVVCVEWKASENIKFESGLKAVCKRFVLAFLAFSVRCNL